MKYKQQLESMSDDELLRGLSALVGNSRSVEPELVAHIGEVDERKLFAGKGSSSMFAYCTDVLHLSEAEAYLRITTARASRQHPELLEMLRDGRLHLSSIAKLAPVLTEANREEVLARAVHRSKRQIEELVAEIAPKPDVPTMVRKLPERREKISPNPGAALCLDGVVAPPLTAAPKAAQSAKLQPLSPARYKITFTAGAELHEMLGRLKGLMRSSVPDGDIAIIIEDAVREKLERLESRRFGKTENPRKSLEETETSPSSRYIPAAVRRVVYERDGNQCSFESEEDRRCTQRDQLEFHHDNPFGRDGDHRPENIHLVCRTHNLYLAEQDYGKDVIEQYGCSGTRVSEPAAVYNVDNDTDGAQWLTPAVSFTGACPGVPMPNSAWTLSSG